MWRVAALALLVCAGCANEDYLWHDTALGEACARLCPGPAYAPTSTLSSPAFYPAVPAGAPAEGAPAAGAAGGKP
jgi:hypothetical protein